MTGVRTGFYNLDLPSAGPAMSGVQSPHHAEGGLDGCLIDAVVNADIADALKRID